MKKEKVILLFIVGALVVVLFMQPFAVYEKGTQGLVRFDTGTPGGTDIFSFGSYQLKVTSSGEIPVFSGCDEINRRCYCDRKTIGVDEFGCTIWEYAAEEGRDPRTGKSCDLTSKCHELMYCKKVCLYDKRSQEGGAEFNNDRTGCFWKADLSYDGVSVYKFEGNTKSYKDPTWISSMSKSMYLDKSGHVVDSVGKATYALSFGESTSSSSECTGIQGSVSLVLNSLEFDLELPEAVQVGDDAYAIFVLENGDVALSGELETTFEIATQLGPVSKTTSSPVFIDIGKNVYQVKIPTNDYTQQMRVSGKMKMFFDKSSWSHVAWSSDTSDDFNGYVGSILSGAKSVTVQIEPIIIEKNTTIIVTNETNTTIVLSPKMKETLESDVLVASLIALIIVILIAIIVRRRK